MTSSSNIGDVLLLFARIACDLHYDDVVLINEPDKPADVNDCLFTFLDGITDPTGKWQSKLLKRYF